MKSLGKSMIAAGLVAGLLAAEYARATVVEVHQFVVMRANPPGTLKVYLNDDFDDSLPPPQSEAKFPFFPFPTVAGLFGSGLFGESCDTVCTDQGDGHTTMDSDNGRLANRTLSLSSGTSIIVDQLVRSQTAQFATNIDDANTVAGLKRNHEIHIVGVFRLVDPDLPRGNYGIQFSDRASTPGDDSILLSVLRRGDTGETFALFARFVGTLEVGVATPIGAIPIPKANFGAPGFEFIVLRLWTNANDDRVFADFAYSATAIDVANTDLDSLLSFTPVPPTDGIDPTIFNGENFTRARFRQLQTLSEVKIAELNSGSPVTLSRTIDTAAAPFNLTFSYRFNEQIGDLSVELTCPNEASPVVLGTIPAPPQITENFTTAQLPVNNPNCLGETVTLAFVFDDASATETATIEIENILGVPNGNFTLGPDGLDGWTVTAEGNASLGVVTLETPADALIVVDKAKVEREDGFDEFKLKGTVAFGPSSDGIDPTSEEVSIVIGDYVETIPPGSFERVDDDDDGIVYKYEGSEGAITKMKIGEDGKFKIAGEQVDFGATDFGSPVPVNMLLGNDLGVGEAVFRVEIDD